MESNIKVYIDKARAKNHPDEKIKADLISNGWSEEQIAQAFAKPADDDDLMPPPPPPPIQHVGMWVGFLYIIFFISLYVLATSIGALLHFWVDAAEPVKLTDTYSYYYGSDNAPIIRGFVASIIVSFPIFMTLALVLKKQLLKQPLVSNLRSRKLLIYLTLIGTFLIMLSHVIMTLYQFLSGEVTATAFKHLMVTFLIAGGVFLYFISEVKHDRKIT